MIINKNRITMKSLNRVGTLKLLALSCVALSMVEGVAFAQEPAPAPAPAPATAPAPDSPPAPAVPEAPQPATSAAPAAPPASTTAAPAAQPSTPASPKPSSTPTQQPSVEVLKLAASTTNTATGSTTTDTESIDIYDDPLKEQIGEYWSTEGRHLDPISGRLFTKNKKFEVSLFFGMEPSDPFWLYLTPGLRLDYFFTEFYGLEFSGSYQIAVPKELNSFFNSDEQKKRAGFGENEPLYGGLYDKAIFRTDLAFIWRPFYGKLGLLSKKLTNFDINFAAGLGINGAMRPDEDHQAAPSFAVNFEFLLGAGASFFITPHWSVRADIRSFYTVGPVTKGSSGFLNRLIVPVEFSLGGTYTF